jgi:hypothetical protein
MDALAVDSAARAETRQAGTSQQDAPRSATASPRKQPSAHRHALAADDDRARSLQLS